MTYYTPVIEVEEQIADTIKFFVSNDFNQSDAVEFLNEVYYSIEDSQTVTFDLFVEFFLKESAYED